MYYRLLKSLKTRQQISRVSLNDLLKPISRHEDISRGLHEVSWSCQLFILWITWPAHFRLTKMERYDLISAVRGTRGSWFFGVSHYQTLPELFGFNRGLPWSGKFPTETAPPTTKIHDSKHVQIDKSLRVLHTLQDPARAENDHRRGTTIRPTWTL